MKGLKGMGRVVARVAGVLPFLAAGFCAVGVAGPKPCQLKQIAQLKVEFDPAGQAYVPVSMDGHSGWMALQLGAGLPGIFEGYIEELGLRGSLKANEWDATYAGRKIEKQVRITSTQVGNANFSGWDYQVLPNGSGYQPRVNGLPFLGVLTSRFMNVVDLELDLGTRQIRLFLPNKCGGIPVYWESDVTSVDLTADSTGQLIFPMEVEGRELLAKLNTGSSLSQMSAEAVSRYLGFGADSPGVEKETLPGDTEASTFRAMTLTAKGLQVRNSKIRIRDMPNCTIRLADRDRLTNRGIGNRPVICGDSLGQTPFSIGTDLMKQLRIYVSLTDRKIYFTRADAGAAKSTAN